MNVIEIEEIQGLYGPVSISEELLQKIWLRGDFSHNNLRTTSGSRLKILSPGTWNQQEGPDFKHAELDIDGRRSFGDVEVHFYTQDWNYHHHDINPQFENVILHVVLFEPAVENHVLRNPSGDIIPTFVLLPVLSQDIEEYALEDALLREDNRDRSDDFLPLIGKSKSKQRCLLKEKACLRWERKQKQVENRLMSNGWQETCHQLFLEVLGYRRNRTAMFDLAIRFPLEEMRDMNEQAEYYFNFEINRWKLAGLRPANHPLARIRQYLSLLEKAPHWAELIKHGFSDLPQLSGDEDDIRHFRREHDLKSLKLHLQNHILAGCFSSTRLNTLLCDVLLPLAAVHTSRPLFPYWFHWYCGDMPRDLNTYLVGTEITDGQNWPACNGFSQGLLQLIIENGL